MAAPQGPTDLTLSGIVDGQDIDAADVTTPLLEAETAIDQARSSLAVSDTDATVKYLQDALSAGAGITITKVNAGGDESIQLSASGGDFVSLGDTPASYSGAAHDVPTVNAGANGLEFMPAVPAGCMLPYMGGAAPVGWLLCDGHAVSMTTYKRLLDVLLTDAYFSSGWRYPAGYGFTADAATDKILLSGHGLANGSVVMFYSDALDLPSGLVEKQPYYVVNAATNDYQVSLTEGGAPVDITDAGSGNLFFFTDFYVPDLRGRAFAGLDNMGGSSANVVTDVAADQVGGTAGAETHTLTESEMPQHRHSFTAYQDSGGSTKRINLEDKTNVGDTQYTNYTGGNGAHNNVQPSYFGNWIIKH